MSIPKMQATTKATASYKNTFMVRLLAMQLKQPSSASIIEEQSALNTCNLQIIFVLGGFWPK